MIMGKTSRSHKPGHGSRARHDKGGKSPANGAEEKSGPKPLDLLRTLLKQPNVVTGGGGGGEEKGNATANLLLQEVQWVTGMGGREQGGRVPTT